MPDVQATVAILDDDESVRRSLRRLLTAVGFRVESYASVSELLGHSPIEAPACLVVDVRMPDTDGIELLRLLALHGHPEPIVLITGYPDVEAGVLAMKHGAVDFLLKPLEESMLLAAVRRGIEVDLESRHDREWLLELRRRHASLTSRERQVCDLVVTGRLNKQIATLLGTTEKTIKLHRARVMRKMDATSLAELVRAMDRLSRGAPRGESSPHPMQPAASGRFGPPRDPAAVSIRDGDVARMPIGDHDVAGMT